MDYKILNAMEPVSFLNPDLFATSWDTMESHVKGETAKHRYQEGLRVSREATRVFISANGTWGAEMKSGALLTSCEGIGYHAHTAALLRGFLDGPAPLVVYRHNISGPTIIKERTGE